MLKGIPRVISPELMNVLKRMGHGDEIVLADGNFPADSQAQILVRTDGLDVPTVLDAILRFLPIDTFVDDPAAVMEPVEVDAAEPPIWGEFRRLLEVHEGRPIALTKVGRYQFYERAQNAYAIVATSETALYANLILKKGVVTEG